MEMTKHKLLFFSFHVLGQSQMRDSQIDQGRVNVHSIQPSNVPEQLSDNASESEPEVLIIPPPQKPKIPLIELE